MSLCQFSLRHLALIAALLGLSAQAVSTTGLDTEVRTDGVESAAGLRSMLRAYGDAYTEIEFLHLRGAEDIPTAALLLASLGPGAENLDYEHPPEVRRTLLEVQAERIRLLLAEGLPSSTLFRTGAGASVSRPYVCVITLDVDALTGDPKAATRFFIENVEAGSALHIDNERFLQFALDHEVFHCLDAYTNGPTRPQTASDVTASYYDLRAEQRADLYAALAHQVRNEAADSMIETIAHFRALSLPAWDLTHYTAPALREALRIERSSVRRMDLRGRARFAMAHADQVMMNAEHYRDFLVAAAEVTRTEGRGEGLNSPLYGEVVSEGRRAEAELVRNLTAEVREAKRLLMSLRFSRK